MRYQESRGLLAGLSYPLASTHAAGANQSAFRIQNASHAGVRTQPGWLMAVRAAVCKVVGNVHPRMVAAEPTGEEPLMCLKFSTFSFQLNCVPGKQPVGTLNWLETQLGRSTFSMPCPVLMLMAVQTGTRQGKSRPTTQSRQAARCAGQMPYFKNGRRV